MREDQEEYSDKFSEEAKDICRQVRTNKSRCRITRRVLLKKTKKRTENSLELEATKYI